MKLPMSSDRRAFLTAAAGGLLLPPLAAHGPRHRPRSVRFDKSPFQLGVASGDPAADGMVLWTRLCVDPLAPDGGIGGNPVDVAWEIAADEGMRKVLRRGVATATADLGHAVHVELDGLDADRWHWFRFRAGDAASPIGRTRTLPAPTARPDRLRFAFASCQHWEQGLFTAFADMAAQDLDLVFHLGDYIYEYAGKDGLVRKHHGGKLKTLADYRVRHAQYRSDPLLQAMHARCPWFVTWDDHEVENNYADLVSENAKVDRDAFARQRAAAYQAYYEAMPLRRRSLPQGPEMRLHRDAQWGDLARFFVLDTRQHRSDQPNGDGKHPLNDAARDPRNTLLGAEQKRWLCDGLAASKATWNVLAQQVMMGLVGFPKPPAAAADAGATAKARARAAAQAATADVEGRRWSMDQWPGYLHERAELLRFLAERKVANPIVLTGDIHAHYVNDLRIDDHDGKAPIVATEFVGSSISSGGDGVDAAGELFELRQHNPGLRYLERRRGYVACTVTPQEWRADYRSLDQVTTPGGRARTAASFVVAAGRPGVR
jgi:alkaline phosphatase D